MKLVKAVRPFGNKFKLLPYNSWEKLGGHTADCYYPSRIFHGLAYRFELPSLIKSKKEARLRFVEPVSLYFDTFPDYIRYEIIPMIWDCWPNHYQKVVKWLKKHNVKSAIFTSSQSAQHIQQELQGLKILVITEGIEVSEYKQGKDLVYRNIDLLEYGSLERNFFREYVAGITHVNRNNENGRLRTKAKLIDSISDAKVCIALPRCDVDNEFTGGIETLTQRFWEGMLSRCVLLGRAPKELIDLIGYNPVVNLDRDNAKEQVVNIIDNIDEYQELVDKNRETALRMASWEIRMKKVMDWLQGLGYNI